MNRAYSLFEVKMVDADRREISGIASTPSVDRVGDVIAPHGAEFSLPIPLLWQHNSAEPIGNVTSANVTDTGIQVDAKLAKTETPGRLKDRLDEAWESLKIGLVRGLSIGFQPLESTPIKGGFRFDRWSWTELSAVTIPANAEASIQQVKFFDSKTTSAEPYSAERLASVKRAFEGQKIKCSASQMTLNQMMFASLLTLQDQVRELETKRKSIEYLGVWQKGTQYERGNFATHDGSVWHCNAATTASRPGSSKDWTLAVKRGRDGK